jgi:hypothetical protein
VGHGWLRTNTKGGRAKHAKEGLEAFDLFELLFDSNVKGVCVCVCMCGLGHGAQLPTR